MQRKNVSRRKNSQLKYAKRKNWLPRHGKSCSVPEIMLNYYQNRITNFHGLRKSVKTDIAKEDVP